MERLIVRDEKSHYVRKDHEDHILNRKNRSGMSPLSLAVRDGLEPIVQHLIEAGCSITLKTHQESVLETACRWNHRVVVEYLLKHQWSKQELNAAWAVAASEGIRELLRKVGGGPSSACCALI